MNDALTLEVWNDFMDNFTLAYGRRQQAVRLAMLTPRFACLGPITVPRWGHPPRVPGDSWEDRADQPPLGVADHLAWLLWEGRR